jgi:hypothetical protein
MVDLSSNGGNSGYGTRPSGSGSVNASGLASPKGQFWKLPKLRRAYSDFLTNKRDEINEQIESRRYRHGSQWTQEQLKILRKRRQPAMTYNRIGRKIDGIIGVCGRLRQDPKAYPRTPKQDEGAELATAAVRYVLDEQQWKSIDPNCCEDAAVDGIGGLEIEIIPGDEGDPEIGLTIVDTSSFFYDPKSWKEDFSDARYLGVGKWVDIDLAEEMFPDAGTGAFSGDPELINQSDREMRWFTTDGPVGRARLVEIWYKNKGRECYAIFTGSTILDEGVSYLQDEKGKDLCKYQMFAAFVDQDGDKYGFVRNLKSAQDGINARQSKMQHILSSRRLILSQGAVDDIEKVRNEWARPDGVVVTNRPVNEGVKADDQSADFVGWSKMLELSLAEIENFGPNPALIGTGVEAKSGRAINLLQQAGLAELGPFILNYRSWKIRVYRAIWNAITRHWKAERWIRVTDDDGLAQFVGVNQLGLDPQTGQPTIVNALGQLDVDIILDEGPDFVNMQAQNFETLQALGPQFALQYPEVALELSPLDPSVKKQMKEKMQQPNPQAMLQLQAAQAQTQNLQADTELKGAQAQKAIADAQAAGQQAVIDREDKILDANMQAQKQAADMAQKQDEHRMAIERHSMEMEKLAASTQEQKAKAQGNTAAIEFKHNTDSIAGPLADAVGQIGQHLAQTQASHSQNILEALNRQGEVMANVLAKHAAPKKITKGSDGSFTVETVG